MSGFPVVCCTQEDPVYPKKLRDIRQSPSKLYYRGDITILNQLQSIAIVGTRDASPHGMEAAHSAGLIAANLSFVVVNGLAIGCDTAALHGAMSVHGKCAVILPCGLDQIYPKSNEELANHILENGGCLISEYSEGIKPQKYFFAQRDRLQSGVSNGVLIIETDDNSGTMHTADYATRQFRRLACYYSNLLQHSAGNQLLIQSGKSEKLETTDAIKEFFVSLKDEPEYEQLAFL